jgi:hypothetical protein
MDMSDQKKPEQPIGPTLAERARIFEREILNAFTVERDTSLADGAGGSTAAENAAAMPEADSQRGKRD